VTIFSPRDSVDLRMFALSVGDDLTDPGTTTNPSISDMVLARISLMTCVFAKPHTRKVGWAV
jgi:hypothetical protein